MMAVDTSITGETLGVVRVLLDRLLALLPPCRACREGGRKDEKRREEKGERIGSDQPRTKETGAH